MQILPRPLGQVLNDAINGLGRTWRPLLSTALMVFIPVGIITLVIFETTDATDFLDLVFNDPSYLATLPNEVFFEVAHPFLQAVALASVLQAVGALFVYLVSHRVVASDIAGTPVSGGEARAQAMRRFGVALLSGLGVLVAVGLILGAGLALWLIPVAVVGTPNAVSVFIATVLFLSFVGPGIWLLVSLSMFAAVIAVEGSGPLRALVRSFRLVRGRWWPTFGFLLLVGLLGSVAIQLIQLVAIPLTVLGDLGTGISVASALGIATQGVIVAAMGAVYTNWYIDLRSRQEPLLSDELGTA